ncbi:hypothetical protein ACLB2K_065497 [Fragaria x ananassa]
MQNNLQVRALPPLPESIPIIHDPIAPHVEEIQHSILVDPQIQVQLSPTQFNVDNLLELTESEALMNNGIGKNMRKLRKTHSPELLFLMETHQQESILKFWKKSLQYDQMYVVNPVATSSGGWLRNLSRCKNALNEWSKDVLPNFGKKVTENIMHIQTLLEDEKEDIGQLLTSKTDKIASYWAMEEMLYKQRSRINWLANGDMNTHFFHQTTTSNRRRNKILQIRDDNGNWITTEPEIVAHFTEYFQNMYTATDLPMLRKS